MQDGAPPWITWRFKQLLRQKLIAEIVISRCFRNAWPPRSLDLTTFDLWQNSKAYHGIFPDIATLKDNITWNVYSCPLWLFMLCIECNLWSIKTAATLNLIWMWEIKGNFHSIFFLFLFFVFYTYALNILSLTFGTNFIMKPLASILLIFPLKFFAILSVTWCFRALWILSVYKWPHCMFNVKKRNVFDFNFLYYFWFMTSLTTIKLIDILYKFSWWLTSMRQF